MVLIWRLSNVDSYSYRNPHNRFCQLNRFGQRFPSPARTICASGGVEALAEAQLLAILNLDLEEFRPQLASHE